MGRKIWIGCMQIICHLIEASTDFSIFRKSLNFATEEELCILPNGKIIATLVVFNKH